MSLFGKDIAENFIPMLTFCDANEPQILKSLTAPDSIFIPILEAIKKYDPWYLKFNNSAIFTSSISAFNKLFWELGMASFKVFIERLKTLTQKSLDFIKDLDNDIRDYTEPMFKKLNDEELNKTLDCLIRLREVIKE